MNIPDLHRKAEDGSVVAQTVLGICYLDGIGVEVNYEEAFRLLSAAAHRRAPRAMANLARMYAQGLGVSQNLSEAIRLYRAAAEAGEFGAQIQLARMYSQGIGVSPNPRAARDWYSRAVAQEESISECDELQEAKNYLEARSEGKR